jgi:hypothetical protein
VVNGVPRRDRRCPRPDREVDRARAKVALPLLGRVKIASPCDARWEDMRGDDRARHCALCDKQVFDLSAMDAAEAEAFLRERVGEPTCVKLRQRADGTILTSDCPIGERRRRRRRLVVAGAAVALTAVAGAIATAASPADPGCRVDDVMGQMAAPDPRPIMGEMVPLPPQSEE